MLMHTSTLLRSSDFVSVALLCVHGRRQVGWMTWMQGKQMYDILMQERGYPSLVHTSCIPTPSLIIFGFIPSGMDFPYIDSQRVAPYCYKQGYRSRTVRHTEDLDTPWINTPKHTSQKREIHIHTAHTTYLPTPITQAGVTIHQVRIIKYLDQNGIKLEKYHVVTMVIGW